MLNWAMSPHVKRLNMAFVLIDEKLADLSDRLTGNPHVATIEVPLPAEHERATFIERVTGGPAALAGFSDFDAPRAREAHRRHLARPISTCWCSRRARAASGSTRRCSAS